MKGHTFDQPKTTAVRPLSDKVRAAIFDVYGDVSGAVVLDVYAGSGAAGFEALSRGASVVEAIESNASVVRVIESNCVALKLSWGYILHALKAETWLGLPRNQQGDGETLGRYDLIIVDPPYAKLDREILSRLARFLVSGGTLVVSHSSKLEAPVLELAKLARHKVYGDTALSFYVAGPVIAGGSRT